MKAGTLQRMVGLVILSGSPVSLGYGIVGAGYIHICHQCCGSREATVEIPLALAGEKPRKLKGMLLARLVRIGSVAGRVFVV